MKTTFKTVFTELDDELMNLDMQENAPVDIDIDKIKSEVFMQIGNKKGAKKKLSKKKMKHSACDLIENLKVGS